jgi:hypothetical protein
MASREALAFINDKSANQSGNGLLSTMTSAIVEADDDAKRKIMMIDIHVDDAEEVLQLYRDCENVYPTYLESGGCKLPDFKEFADKVESEPMLKKLRHLTLSDISTDVDINLYVFVQICQKLWQTKKLQPAKVREIIIQIRHGVCFHSPLGGLDNFHNIFNAVVPDEHKERLETQEYLDGILTTPMNTDMWCNVNFKHVV